MIKLIIFFCIIFLDLFSLPIWQKKFKKLDSREKKCLELFFRTMLKDSEGGYVLFGSKPACGNGILGYSSMFEHSLKEQNISVVLYEGWQVWKKHFSNLRTKNLIICCKKNPFAPNEWKQDIYWVHKSKFLQVINNNLLMFQYALGPQVTPLAFLEFFLDPDKELPKDQALIGIFLGFGRNNSLYGNRSEKIFYDFAICKETFPLAARRQRLKILYDNIFEKVFDTQHEVFSELKPSFGYENISNEWKDLRKKSSVSTDSISLESPKIPTYGIYSTDLETKNIQKAYLKDQKKINKLLKRNDFLFYVLKLIFEK